MKFDKIVTGETPFQIDAESVIIGSSESGYTLYAGPSSDDLQVYKAPDGSDVEVAANHPLTVMCARGTWFKLVDNTGTVKINY